MHHFLHRRVVAQGGVGVLESAEYLLEELRLLDRYARPSRQQRGQCVFERLGRCREMALPREDQSLLEQTRQVRSLRAVKIRA
jgi:hypothetical protein